jgi:hypothetical protein
VIDWSAKITELGLVSRAPASEAQLTDAEAKLAVRLPDELRALVLASDGVRGEYELRLVWSVEKIANENLAFRENADFRTLYMPFDHLLFFGDAGNGDQFAFTVLAGEVRRRDVFVWNHETDSRTWIAPNLPMFLEWWCAGRIAI